MLQTCVDFGAKYGKFDLAETLYTRKTVSRATASMAAEVKAALIVRLKPMVEDGTVLLTVNMYTDDYRKQAYVDVHAVWIERDYSVQHAALAVCHFGTLAHTGENICNSINNIMDEYGLPNEDTPVTTDHGSNVVAALRNSVRVDCLCHRLRTVLETAWRDTKREEPEAAAYEVAVSDLCRFVKQSTGLQEQLPKSLKHGGDTRPWVSMYRRADSIEASYEALVAVLTAKNRLELVANVNRGLNRELMELTKNMKTVFESLEKVNEPTLQLVVPSYYLLALKFKAGIRDSTVMTTFRQHLMKYLDDKFWSSITAFHWMAIFMDPSFKQFDFIPQLTGDDVRFKRNLLKDIDNWMATEIKVVAEKLEERNDTESSRLELYIT